ncbi:hypothetical protein QBC46DRAFT_366841 [Diplogelasinospora grovesii]|uniref:FAD-binding PCMH-type domain-containing protein n=1 Tax=Diplogelasinospora grovesii TaxID=303347 RepID=A0AAN6S0E0_9PEZI|nr:hypothetical protein QBC46DRAFT_366841 [Diplogelasinospora grovesii]
MRPLSFTAVSSLALIRSFAAGLTVPSSEAQIERTRCSVSAQVHKELVSLLSSNATILGPSDANWANETERYMQNVKPQVCLSVRPGSEDDVAKIVRFANQHDIPFYAVSRGHALTSSVGRFKGIEIDLRNLKAVHINPGNATAHFQGGAYSYEVINTLWEQGYVTGNLCSTATGGCECVSVLGPALGGGHGLQQGQHGLTSDHFVNLNVVLANGTAIQVNETSHPDLLSKIWPDNFKKYFVKTYQFAGSSLEPLIKAIDKFQGNGTLAPPWLATFGLYTMNTTLSQTEATISWVFLYDGAQEDAEPALKPFDDLGPLSVDEVNVPYSVINDYVGGSIDGWLCEPNKTHIIGTAGLQTFNVTAMRAIYDLYNHKVVQHPQLGDTRVLVEGYSVQGVLSFPSDDSAYPLRDDYILTYFDTRFDTTDDPLIDFAAEWRDQTVALWNGGQPGRKPTTYVNYAAGYESLEARYGYEPWRLERLRDLKRQYDPDNRFAWYNPIVPRHTENY